MLRNAHSNHLLKIVQKIVLSSVSVQVSTQKLSKAAFLFRDPKKKRFVAMDRSLCSLFSDVLFCSKNKRRKVNLSLMLGDLPPEESDDQGGRRSLVQTANSWTAPTSSSSLRGLDACYTHHQLNHQSSISLDDLSNKDKDDEEVDEDILEDGDKDKDEDKDEANDDEANDDEANDDEANDDEANDDEANDDEANDEDIIEEDDEDYDEDCDEDNDDKDNDDKDNDEEDNDEEDNDEEDNDEDDMRNNDVIEDNDIIEDNDEDKEDEFPFEEDQQLEDKKKKELKKDMRKPMRSMTVEHLSQRDLPAGITNPSKVVTGSCDFFALCKGSSNNLVWKRSEIKNVRVSPTNKIFDGNIGLIAVACPNYESLSNGCRGHTAMVLINKKWHLHLIWRLTPKFVHGCKLTDCETKQDSKFSIEEVFTEFDGGGTIFKFVSLCPFQFDLQPVHSELIDPAFINQHDKCLNCGRRPSSFFVPKPNVFLKFENTNTKSNAKRSKRKHRRRGGCRHSKKQKMHWLRSKTPPNKALAIFVSHDMLKNSMMHKISRCNSDGNNPFFWFPILMRDLESKTIIHLCH